MHAFLATPWAFQAAVITALGLCVGSFLNVVIHRVPIMLERDFHAWARETLAADGPGTDRAPAPEAAGAPHGAGDDASVPGHEFAERPGDPATEDGDAGRFDLIKPDSHCPRCKAPIRAWQNVPVLSWLLLRGRCASCALPIPVRYPLVELGTGAITLLAVLQFGPASAQLWAALPCLWTLIALSMIDFDHQILPDDMTYPLLWGGLLLSVFPVFVGPTDAIVGAAAGYLSLWSVYWAFKLLTGREGMGHGDFKLLAAAGAWTGWMALPYLVLVASFAGLLIQGAIIGFGARGREQPFAFGPYLAVAFAVLLLFRDELARYAGVPLN